jgi:hypothetical protein
MGGTTSKLKAVRGWWSCHKNITLLLVGLTHQRHYVWVPYCIQYSHGVCFTLLEQAAIGKCPKHGKYNSYTTEFKMMVINYMEKNRNYTSSLYHSKFSQYYAVIIFLTSIYGVKLYPEEYGRFAYFTHYHLQTQILG